MSFLREHRIFPGQAAYEPGLYEETMKKGHDLQQKPFNAATEKNVQRQHLKKRMTIWERIKVLCDVDVEPQVLFQNNPNPKVSEQELLRE